MITLGQVHAMGIDMAIKRGPRSQKDIADELKRLKKEYDKFDEKKKKYFDLDSLKNPFLDSRIEFGDPNTKLKRVLTGIDMAVGEVLLAHELGKMGKKVDAIIAHHPEGRGLISLTQVMEVQDDIAVIDGVPVNISEKLLNVRVGELNRGLHATNHYRVINAAKLLDVPYMQLHTAADNNCYWFLKNHIEKKKPKYVGDIMDAVMEIPEYQEAARLGNKPIIACGDEKSRVGKISFSGITGGTTGSKDIYEKMAQAGVGTLVVMHIPEEHRKLVEQFHMNVVVLSHMASDSIGMNLILDEVEKKGVEVVACGGLIRVKR
ncbi:MAG TPA: NGG1p interacting factor NIF3 [Candidatus Gracilibacteria bacterium]|nr:NGG1p interacting factor NIF3 [Candidatus Gracilibacteria bacterium]